MNIKSLNKYGLTTRSNDFVENNAYFIIPRGDTLPPYSASTNQAVFGNAQIVANGGYKFCYILPTSTDSNGNTAVFYDGNAYPLNPGAFLEGGNSYGHTYTPYFITNSSGNSIIGNAIYTIQYNGSFTPPVGDPDNVTTVNVVVTMIQPAAVTFTFSYQIFPQSTLQVTYSFNDQVITYNGSGYDMGQNFTTNSDVAPVFSYVGTNSTTYGPSSKPPVNSGTYKVTATCNADYVYPAITATANLTIQKITSLTGFAFTTSQSYYTGNPVPLTCLTTPAGLGYTVLYNGSTTPPTNIGSYVVQTQIVDPNVDPNATGAIIQGTYNIVRSNQIPNTAANSTTIVRATYSAATQKFLVDFVGTYQ